MVDMTGSLDFRGSLEFRKPWTLGVARTDINSLLTIVIIFTTLSVTEYALGYRILMIPLVAFAVLMVYGMSKNIVETTRPRTVTLSRDRISMREGGKVRTIEFGSSVELEVGLREWVPDPEGPRGPAGPDQLESYIDVLSGDEVRCSGCGGVMEPTVLEYVRNGRWEIILF